MAEYSREELEEAEREIAAELGVPWVGMSAGLPSRRHPNRARSKARFLRWLAPVFLVGGVAALIGPIRTLMVLGECAEPVEGFPGYCRRVFVFGPISTGLTVLGVSLLAVAIVSLARSSRAGRT